ncbi:MAG: hypothetical protein ACXV2D_05610 [Halobacteriota archaeon]
MAKLFEMRADIPNDAWPLLAPKVDDYTFPDYLLDKQLERSLNPTRLAQIRADVLKVSGERIHYYAPYNYVLPRPADMVLSQAVIEHVNDIGGTYTTLARWPKKSGLLSQEVDFACHGLADAWNGHWGYSDRLWRIIKGGRVYLINREPYSTHASCMKEDFTLIQSRRTTDRDGISRTMLAKRFHGMSDEDLTTKSAFIQAIKA